MWISVRPYVPDQPQFRLDALPTTDVSLSCYKRWQDHVTKHVFEGIAEIRGGIVCWTLNRSRAVRAVHQRWCQRRSMVGVLVVVGFLGSFVALAGCTQADADDGLPVLTSYMSLEPEVVETPEPDPALEKEIREALGKPLLIKEEGMAAAVYRLNTASSPLDATLRSDGYWDYKNGQWALRYPCEIPEVRHRTIASGFEIGDIKERFRANPYSQSCSIDGMEFTGVQLVLYKYDRANGEDEYGPYELHEYKGFEYMTMEVPTLAGPECYAFIDTQAGPIGVTVQIQEKVTDSHIAYETFEGACGRATHDFKKIFLGD